MKSIALNGVPSAGFGMRHEARGMGGLASSLDRLIHVLRRTTSIFLRRSKFGGAGPPRTLHLELVKKVEALPTVTRAGTAEARRTATHASSFVPHAQLGTGTQHSALFTSYWPGTSP